jgi:hypothetical protein
MIPFKCTKEYENSEVVFGLQIILDLCIPEKELANTRSQISILYFQSHL